MKISINGDEFDLRHKRMRVDALMVMAGLNPLKDRLIEVDGDRRKLIELVCLRDVVEIFEGMCFVSSP